MQQLNMIVSFRETILETEELSSTSQKESLDESALFQVKNIFASLKFFEGKYHNPKDFCNNFKKYDGQVINIIEQMDVDEFFNLLIERVEPYLKSTPSEKVFKYHFGGKTSNELICKDCPHKNEREDFYCSISLQVKNKKNLVESLESYVEGEMLEGDNAYHCEPCDKKVRAMKRQSIKILPRYLVLALRRFEFDYETMVKVKVNDAFEFPMELDMEPYTQEYLMKKEKEGIQGNKEDKVNVDIKMDFDSSMDSSNIRLKKNKHNYKYKLTGVIIHTGTADSGHYYSIVKDNKENWLEFNDTNVSYYDIADLPGEAFGGLENFTYKDQSKVEKVTNAYLLFYEKDLQSDLANDDNFKPVLEAKIAPTIMDRTNLDNFKYWVSKILFSNEYFDFIQDLLLNYKTFDHYVKNYSTKNIINTKPNSIGYSNINDCLLVKHKPPNTKQAEENILKLNSPEFELQIFKFSINFFFTLLMRAKEKTNHLANLMDILKAQINKNSANAANAEWLIEEFSVPDIIFEFLVETPIVEMRKLTVGLLYCAMLRLFPIVKEKLLKDETDSLSNFIKTILFLISVTPKKDHTQLHFLIWRFSKLGAEAVQYLVNIGYLEYACVFYLQKLGLKNDVQVNDILRGNIKYETGKHKEIYQKLMSHPDRSSYLEDLQEKKHWEKLPGSSNSSILMTYCEILRSIKQLTSTTSTLENNNLYYNNYNIEVPKELKTLLQFNKPILKALLNECRNKITSHSFGNLVGYISFNNSEISNTIQTILLESIESNDYSELENSTMKVFFNFLSIEDNLREQRVFKSLIMLIS